MKDFFLREEIPDELIEFFEEVTPEPITCIILDPFCGSGRTGLVAKRLGRDALLIDAKADYVKLAKQLCGES